ncbi:hypothetical protein EXIGLDRAFT_765068 [Exidia glandulosa HHB12029]|uniref:Uncharacterized protein n=1 Tax=Exidia glandulosa HHB12029 TaxID=1314781 RepID=A0A165KT16_EXIGL|nr:hypothetical protein EXIGLDRAFT_765068 [Exidia glandulosa HHB12029]
MSQSITIPFPLRFLSSSPYNLLLSITAALLTSTPRAVLYACQTLQVALKGLVKVGIHRLPGGGSDVSGEGRKGRRLRGSNPPAGDGSDTEAVILLLRR